MEWRACPRFPDFEVSEYGDIRRCVPNYHGHSYGHAVKSRICRYGYKVCKVRLDGKSYNVFSHRMVAEAFLGPQPFVGAEVCHGDGIKLNCHYTNLRWDTRKANRLDMIKHGASARGIRHHRVKLKPEQVLEIRSRYAAGELQRHMAAEFGVVQSAISSIVNGAKWGWLVSPSHDPA